MVVTTLWSTLTINKATVIVVVVVIVFVVVIVVVVVVLLVVLGLVYSAGREVSGGKKGTINKATGREASVKASSNLLASDKSGYLTVTHWQLKWKCFHTKNNFHLADLCAKHTFELH